MKKWQMVFACVILLSMTVGCGGTSVNTTVNNGNGDTKYSLAVTVSPTIDVGAVGLTPAGEKFVTGTIVQLSPLPKAGYRFKEWSGPNKDDVTTDNKITMNSNKSITAIFEKNQGPSAPSELKSTVVSGAINLQWKAVSGAESYRVYRSTTAGVGYSRLAENLNMIVYEDNNVANGNIYYYVVTAVSATGESGYSNEVSGILSNDSKAVLSGKVYDKITQSAVADAKVTVDGISGITDAYGNYYFNNLTAGIKSVVATKDNYYKAKTTATVVAGASSTKVDIAIKAANQKQLSGTASIKGTISF